MIDLTKQQRLNLNLDKELIKRAKIFCAINNMSLTTFIDQSMRNNLKDIMDLKINGETILSGATPSSMKPDAT